MYYLYVNQYRDGTGRTVWDDPVTSREKALEQVRERHQRADRLQGRAYDFDWQYVATLEFPTTSAVLHDLEGAA